MAKGCTNDIVATDPVNRKIKPQKRKNAIPVTQKVCKTHANDKRTNLMSLMI